jgi:hypothetical protein
MSLKCVNSLSHREIMDLLMLAKDSRVYGNDLMDVSKTKIRGVLSLVKNAHVVTASEPGEGESIQLFLGKDITLFQQFREKQDAFINKCCMLQHIFIPLSIKGELVWIPSPNDSRDNFVSKRTDELKSYESILEKFFLNELAKKKSGDSVSSTSSSIHHQSQRVICQSSTSGLTFGSHGNVSSAGRGFFPGLFSGDENGQLVRHTGSYVVSAPLSSLPQSSSFSSALSLSLSGNGLSTGNSSDVNSGLSFF